jgi:hypothetical protein
MSQISLEDADLILDKLISERVPLVAFLSTPSGLYAKLSGFLDSKTDEVGLVISVARPPSAGVAYFEVPAAKCEFLYGEVREFPELQKDFADKYGESALIVRFPRTGELLRLFFTA